MLKLIHFSEKSLLEIYPELQEFKKEIEVFSDIESLSPEALLKSDFDFIELGEGDFQKFAPYFKALDLRTNRLGSADSLMKVVKGFRPMHLIVDSTYQCILEKVPDLKTSGTAVMLGTPDFVYSMAYKLAQSGFHKIILSTDKEEECSRIGTQLKTFSFNMDVTAVPLGELTQLESDSVLMVSNLKKKDNPEAYESLSYFNFLARGAAFVDLNSKLESSLTDEARRAEIITIEEIDILKMKYRTLLELFKNSSLV